MIGLTEGGQLHIGLLQERLPHRHSGCRHKSLYENDVERSMVLRLSNQPLRQDGGKHYQQQWV